MKISIKKLGSAAVLATAAQMLFAHNVMAAPDLVIKQMKLLTQPRVGACNKIALTIANIGDQTSKGTKGAIITYPQGNAFQNRSQKSFYFAPLRVNKTRTITLSKIEILPLGNVTIQSTINAPQAFVENNFNNNSETALANVTQNCRQRGGTNLAANNACDLKLEFTAPTGNVIPDDDSTTFTVLAENVGSSDCPKRSVRLYRYSGSSASGYGSAVGGTSGSMRQIPILQPGASETLEWSVNPGGTGTFTYATKTTSAHNDANNSNHRPKKTVVAQ